MTKTVAIIGASGYTGAELIRILATHPDIRIGALCANAKAGMTIAQVFPHLRHLDLPPLVTVDQVDWTGIDLAFAALPHGTSQEIVAGLPEHVKCVDLSAGFRLRDPAVYEKWYGDAHRALHLQESAVYGLSEFYRDEISAAHLVAGTGCNAATGMFAILPLLGAGVIDPDEIILDMFCGVSGAGRAAKEGMLHSEVSEGTHPYGLPVHRHTSEFDQEFSKAAGQKVEVIFTPHLMPANRGILCTAHVRGDADAIHAAMVARYADEPFVVVLPLGEAPATRHVRGSNFVHVGVVADRKAGRVRVFSALDNLAKGSSGQAIQNANLMLGLDETAGLMLAPMFP